MGLSNLPALLSLAGTLTPEGIQSAAQREEEARVAELSSRAQGLQMQAGQAQQSYQQAAAAPPPGFLPGDSFVPQILGALASVIGQSPQFSQQAEEGITQRRSALLKARAENLEALSDVARQKAQAAKEAGDLEEEFKNRTIIERNARLLENVRLSHKQAFDREQNELDRKAAMDREKLRAQTDLAATQIREGNKAGDPQVVQTVTNMADYVLDTGDLSTIPAEYRPSVIDEVARRGQKILPQKARTTLNTLNAGRQTLKRLRDLHGQLDLPKDFKERITKGGKNVIQAFTQQNPKAAEYVRIKKGLLASLSRSTGERGTLTNQDIARGEGLLPGLTDIGDVSEGLFGEFEQWLNGQEDQIIQNFTQPGGGTSRAPAAPKTAAQATQADRDYVKTLGY